jgi:hypothetical protein
MTLHTAFATQLNTDVIAGLTNLDTQTNPEVDNESSIGSPYPQFVVILSQQPRIQFASRAVAAALAITGSTGAAIADAAEFKAFYASLGDDGLPAAGSVHRSYTANRGLLLPRRLSANARQNAQLDLEALVYSEDGSTHPLVIADNVALPTIPQNNIQHAIGPVDLGVSGSTFSFGCPQSIEIDFQSNAETVACGSDLYDTHLQQPAIQPVITLTGLDASAFASGTLPPAGLPIEHAGTTIYLRKRAENGVGFVAGATLEHIKLTAHGVAVVTQHTGQGNQRAELSVRLTCGWDGTNAPIVIDTAAELPA